MSIKHRHGHATHRDAIWAVIRDLHEFSVSEIEDKTRISHGSIKTYILGLTKAGYLKRTEHHHRAKVDNRFVANRWQLIKDIGVDAPRITRDGKRITQGLSRENMWHAMRILRDFSSKDLAAQASTDDVIIKHADAKNYIKYLHKAGYLIIVIPAKLGTQTRYRMPASRYTGPRPPMIQRTKQVFDPNTGKVVWPKQRDETKHDHGVRQYSLKRYARS
ncbi:hypothetical protein MNBD_GAMMA20-2015 [hydrothermal vent metagenome]|uniref:Uncharacterized protein n=1 Tax=hydrothermal vent metagenome TaxID=652676 RepID=A0A3B1A952_9ZZZZ